jgi:hypothetical protein
VKTLFLKTFKNIVLLSLKMVDNKNISHPIFSTELSDRFRSVFNIIPKHQEIILDDVNSLNPDLKSFVTDAYEYCFRNDRDYDLDSLMLSAKRMSDIFYHEFPFLKYDSFCYIKNNVSNDQYVDDVIRYLNTFKKPRLLSDLVLLQELDCIGHCLSVREILKDGWDIYQSYDLVNNSFKKKRHAVLSKIVGNDDYNLIFDSSLGIYNYNSGIIGQNIFLLPRYEFNKKYYKSSIRLNK